MDAFLEDDGVEACQLAEGEASGESGESAVGRNARVTIPHAAAAQV